MVSDGGQAGGVGRGPTIPDVRKTTVFCDLLPKPVSGNFKLLDDIRRQEDVVNDPIGQLSGISITRRR